MNWIAALGATCFGGVIGVIAGFFIGEARELTFRVITSAIGIFAGAGVVYAFQLLGSYSEPGQAVWFYPVGLAIGLFLGLRYAYPPLPPKA